MKKNNRGFTLVEVIVVAAIIAILAGILVPMIMSQIDDSKITRAQGDVKQIATAVARFRSEIGYYPTFNPAVAFTADPSTGSVVPPANFNILHTDGTVQALPASFTSDMPDDMANHLSSKAEASALYGATGYYGKKWKGPYLSSFSADPWGNAYVVNVWNDDGLGATGKNVWVLSAGPNGTFETEVTAAKPGGDDIGVVAGSKAYTP